MPMCRCAYMLPPALPRPKINPGGAQLYVLPMHCNEEHGWVPPSNCTHTEALLGPQRKQQMKVRAQNGLKPFWPKFLRDVCVGVVCSLRSFFKPADDSCYCLRPGARQTLRYCVHSMSCVFWRPRGGSKHTTHRLMRRTHNSHSGIVACHFQLSPGEG